MCMYWAYLLFVMLTVGLVCSRCSKMFGELTNIFSNMQNYSRQEIHCISQTKQIKTRYKVDIHLLEPK